MHSTEGPVAVSSQNNKKGEPDKVHLVICQCWACALQETKWFWNEMYEVDSCILLTTGRKVPVDGEMIQRDEGVVLVLNGVAIDAWKHSGKQWKAWSS